MKYLIWSNRKRMFHRADMQGYTPIVTAAGRFTQKEAADAVFHSLPGANIPIDEELAESLQVRDDEVESMIAFWSRL